jgi:phosphoglycolate phosphatase
MRLNTFLFDLDGTLLDHFKAIHRCHTFTLRQLGLPPPTMAQVHAAVGAGLETAIVRLAGADRLKEALPIYCAHWDATMLDDVELLPGSRELILALNAAGGHCAIFTNKRGDSSRLLCDHLGLTAHLAGIFGAHDTPWLKPDPRFARHVLGKINAEAATTCLVGDSVYDCEAARNAGLEFYGVTTGTHTAEQLHAAGAMHVFADLIALAPVLLS